MKTNHLIISSLLFIFFSGCKEDPKEISTNALEEHIEYDIGIQNFTAPLSTSTFLALSDVHLESGTGNTSFGRYNDTGDSLWLRTKTKLEEVIKKEQPKFMVYLGDLPGHSDDNRRTNVKAMLKNLRSLDMDIPLLYLPGNNDALGGDYDSFQDRAGENPFSVDKNKTQPWPVLHDSTGIAKISNKQFNSKFGFYSADLNIGKDVLKIIALNSVIFTKHFYYSDDNVSQQDAAQIQFDWLEKTLDGLDNNQPVFIMMHIPPGRDNYSSSHLMWNDKYRVTDKNGNSNTFQDAFLNLVKGRKNQIKGILTSHTHFDGIRRLYSSETEDPNNLIGITMSTPGITIGHGNNPGFKLYTYDDTTYDITDFKTYFAIPTDSTYNDFKEKYIKGTFKFIGDSTYTFKNTYKVTNPRESIFKSVSNMTSKELKNGMSKIIAVKSLNTDGIVYGYDFNRVMNVLYNE